MLKRVQHDMIVLMTKSVFRFSGDAFFFAKHNLRIDFSRTKQPVYHLFVKKYNALLQGCWLQTKCQKLKPSARLKTFQNLCQTQKNSLN